MKKHQNKEALYGRMRHLAKIKDSVNESNSNSLGDLVNFKTGADGMSYGIVRENHSYFIKKSQSKNPSVSDFTYIGGLENKLNYRFPKLSEADKQRNMILNSINESMSVRFDPNTGKKIQLNEADEDIEKAEEKMDDLEVATEKEKVEPATEPDFDAMGMGQDDETPAPEGGEEMPEPADEPAPEDEPESVEEPEEVPSEETPEEPAEEVPSEETPEDDVAGDDETNIEIQKAIGKVTHKIREAEMTPAQIKSYVNSFLAAFNEKLPDVEIEDRKDMADKILKVEEDAEEELEAVGVEENVEEKESVCEESRFVEYVQERGYTKESIHEASEDEVTNLAGGFANEYEDELSECDYNHMSLFVKPHQVNTLADEYGLNGVAKELAPYVKSINETSDEDRMAKINELAWGKGDIKVDEAPVDHVEVQPDLKDNINEDEDEIDVEDLDLGDEEPEEKPEEKPEEEPKMDFAPPGETLGIDTGRKNKKDVNVDVDAEEGTVNVQMSESEKKIRSYVRKRLQEMLKGKKININEGNKSKALKELDEMIYVEYSKRKKNKPVNESEEKVRKYVRNRLEEKMGLKKSNLNESKKSEKLQKLDEMIDKQLNNFKKSKLKASKKK